MRSALRYSDIAAARGFDVEIATLDDWGPAGRRLDGVVSGQAWHWADPVKGAAKVARVDAAVGRDDFLEQVPTAGGHQRSAPDKLAELLTGLASAIDAAGGGFTMRYATLALVCGLD